MSLLLGPILYARASTELEWNFCVQITVKRKTKLSSIQLTFPGLTPISCTCDEQFYSDDDVLVVQWAISVERKDYECSINYQVCVDEETTHVDNVVIPPRGQLPRIAAFSCAGFSGQPSAAEDENAGALWKRLLEMHQEGDQSEHDDVPSGFGLLLGLGDQIYCDRLRDGHEWTKWKESKAKREYMRHYRSTWMSNRHRPMMEVLSRVPLLATWDDHDIFNGYGSYPPKQAQAYKRLFQGASAAFRVNQLGSKPKDPPPLKTPFRVKNARHVLQAMSYHTESSWLDVVMLDVRTDRTVDQVLSAAQWSELTQWLESYSQTAAMSPTPSKHVLVVSSIPITYLDFRCAGRILRALPGSQLGETDVLDRWENHQPEQLRLLMRLFQAQEASGARITLLSGDVHVGSRGVISLDGKTPINQFTTSGIVHPPPSMLHHIGLLAITTDGPRRLSEQLTAEVVDVRDGERLLRSRNFATIIFDGPLGGGRMWLRWLAEDNERRPMLVVDAEHQSDIRDTLLASSITTPTSFVAGSTASTDGSWWDKVETSYANGAHHFLEQKRRGKYRYRRGAGRPRVLALGDSWFAYPALNGDLLDQIIENTKLAIYPVSHWGDKLDEMNNDQTWRQVLAEEQPALMLLSGGGNDTIGDNLPKWIIPTAPFIKVQEYQAHVGALIDTTMKIYEEAQRRRPGIRLVVHGYDYPIPLDEENSTDVERRTGLGKGRWLTDGLEHVPKQSREQVVKTLVKDFNEALKEQADKTPALIYIDLRNTLSGAQMWHDEIHPNHKGYTQLGSRYLQQLRKSLA